jgi:alpha-L-arabinofuranosidase
MTIGETSYPAVSVVASEDVGHVYLVAINLDPDAAHSFSWRQAGNGVSGSASESLLTAPPLETDNWASWGKPDQALSIAESKMPVAKGVVSFQLPPHSMAGITIEKPAN